MSWQSYQKTYLKRLHKQIKRRIILYAIIAFMISLSISLYIGMREHAANPRPNKTEQTKVKSQFTSTVQPQIASEMPSITKIKSVPSYHLKENNIERWIKFIMREYSVKYGAVVAIDIKTCKPIAIVNIGKGFSVFKAYPAASLAKLITAAAAIELHHIPSYALFYYDSRNSSQSIGALTDGYDYGKKSITFSIALAKSNNPVFGKLALYKIGAANLQSYFDRFYFNKSLGPSFIEHSTAVVGDSGDDIALTGAGLNTGVLLSPFHAALIAQAIGSGGNMCVPYTRFDNHVQIKKRIIAASTAKELLDMMRFTITKGTSRRAFYNRRGHYILANISVAGKTGSIHGTGPEGDYEWFIGIAPVNNPEVAVAVLVVNGEKWTVKGSYLGAQTFFAYFFPDAVKKLLR